MKDTKHLRNRNGVWYFQKNINGKLYSKSLKTDSLKTAQHARDLLLRELPFSNPTLEASPKALRDLVESFRSDMQTFYELNKGDSEERRLAHFFDVESPEEAKDEGNLLKADALLIADAIISGHPENIEFPHTHIKMDYTLQEVAKEFLEITKAHKHFTTYNAYKRGVENFIDYKKEKFIYLKDITRGTVIKFLTFLSQEKNLGRKSILNELGGLIGCFQYAQDRDWIPLTLTNPFKEVPINSVCSSNSSAEPNSNNDPITPQEFEIVQKSINDNKKLSDERKWIIPIALVSGMRLAELMGLQKSDIRCINDVWCFDVIPNKYRRLKNRNAKRLIPIHHSVLDAVLKLKTESPNELLFEEAGRNKRVGATVGAWYSKLKKKLSINPRHTFHGLRANFATALENAGVEEVIAATLLGHSKNTLSYGLYSKGHEVKLLKENIEKITSYYSKYFEFFPEK